MFDGQIQSQIRGKNSSNKKWQKPSKKNKIFRRKFQNSTWQTPTPKKHIFPLFRVSHNYENIHTLIVKYKMYHLRDTIINNIEKKLFFTQKIDLVQQRIVRVKHHVKFDTKFS